ncbi:LPP20 family lipoprotein [Plebeiibacterium marinum]|uniref:LPP20 family lipoprotein n=1 Tax=Plebeiibacterium marinum TaxID=2992111 RepID=A0AAE3MDV8_9BACT|nr:LPP20 family lipoprotein [Plebeiobacterium marinum]MCW3805993.1 LPP20 family lipoprotein [Plebeiobacterium marinum]
MIFKNISCLFFVLVLMNCSSTKKQAELLEQTKPGWLKERPSNDLYYHGIGIVPKVGSPMLYEDKAKNKALADISGQINANIKAEAVMYQVEDKNGVHDYLQNRIKSTSTEFLEGYEYEDKWEDLSNTYVYYRLSKQVYKELKAKRKAEAIEAAKSKYEEGQTQFGNNNFVVAIQQFASCIDLLSGYLNETTFANVEGQQVDLVAKSGAIIADVLQDIELTSNNADGVEVSCDGHIVANFPIKFEYSGGYLVNDKIKSNEKGRGALPALPNGTNPSGNTLKAAVDLVSLGRQVTQNLYVRKIIENQKAAEILMKL